MSKRLVSLVHLILTLLFCISTSFGGEGTIQLPCTGQTTCYDSFGAEINCAGSGQDGEIQQGVPWPNPRFTDNVDGTITDNLTGLMWAKDAGTPTVETCVGGGKTWEEGLIYIECLNSHNYLGHSDWRLPNINEMESLVNSGTTNSATWLESQGFVNVWFALNDVIHSYPSSTSFPRGPTNTIMSVILDGTITIGTKFAISWLAWPVRLGQSGVTDPTYPANLWKTGQTNSYYPGDDGRHTKRS